MPDVPTDFVEGPAPRRGVIDQFEGDLAVIVFEDDEQLVVPRSTLPPTRAPAMWSGSVPRLRLKLRPVRPPLTPSRSRRRLKWMQTIPRPAESAFAICSMIFSSSQRFGLVQLARP